LKREPVQSEASDALRRRLGKIPWYHRIDLRNDVRSGPGCPLPPACPTAFAAADPKHASPSRRAPHRNGGGRRREASSLLSNGIPREEQRIYEDVSTWWAPTIACLFEMLRASLLDPLRETMRITPAHDRQGRLLQRAALVCRAEGGDSLPPTLRRELTRSYRNPGLAGPATAE
jgi:hypothetical protein